MRGMGSIRPEDQAATLAVLLKALFGRCEPLNKDRWSVVDE